jgi:hypothetical protein
MRGAQLPLPYWGCNVWCFVRFGGSVFGASARRREGDNRVVELLLAPRDSQAVSESSQRTPRGGGSSSSAQERAGNAGAFMQVMLRTTIGLRRAYRGCISGGSGVGYCLHRTTLLADLSTQQVNPLNQRTPRANTHQHIQGLACMHKSTVQPAYINGRPRHQWSRGSSIRPKSCHRAHASLTFRFLVWLCGLARLRTRLPDNRCSVVPMFFP